MKIPKRLFVASEPMIFGPKENRSARHGRCRTLVTHAGTAQIRRGLVVYGRQRPWRAEIFALPEFGFASLYGHAFRKIAGLIDIATELHRETIGKELERDDRQNR